MKCSVGASAICILLLACILPRIQGIPLSWLKPWTAWGSSSPNDSDESNQGLQEELNDFDPEHVPSQLRLVICPAKSGRELQDYWRCLWGTSLTVMGMEQERRGLVEAYYEGANYRPEPGYFVRKKQAEMMKQRKAAVKHEQAETIAKRLPGGIRGKGKVKHPLPKLRQVEGGGDVVGGTGLAAGDLEGVVDITTVNESDAEVNVISHSDVPSKRVKRASTSADVDNVKNLNKRGFVKYAKISAWDYDLKDLILDPGKEDEIRKCQEQFIAPGMSLTLFIVCLRDKSNFHMSRWPEFQAPTYPDVDIPYDPKEFPLIDLDLNGNMADDYDESDQRDNYTLRFGYDRIKGDVDEIKNFGGADPYLREQVGDFRYRFDNVVTGQALPPWTYIGKNGAHSWHKQELKKFFLPLQGNTDLKKAAFVADFAQTYPGLGEIAAQESHVDTPMNYNWQKDKGYYSHTRYLLPLLDNDDLTYYKYKKLVDDSVTLKPDAEVIENIIQSLEHFLKDTSLPVTDSRTYPAVEDIPFLQTYRDFLDHYYGVDFSSYIEDRNAYLTGIGQTSKKIVENDIRDTYEVMRKINRHYVRAVLAQQKCMKMMVEKYDSERSGDDLEDLLNQAKQSCTLPVEGAGMKTEGEDKEKYLKKLYKMYFERKKSRQAYSLPVYPINYPLCKHSEQSPIDIITSKGRESSLREYQFGGSGYRLNRFFLTMPNDGSPLLSVGIFQGERLDDSSPKMTGGAVKGQYLSFQYMFLRFAKDWLDVGSEHHVDGVGAPMEIQMLFTLTGSGDFIKYWQILSRVQNELFQFRGKLVIILSVLVDVLIDDEAVVKTIKEKQTNQDPYLFEPLAQAAYRFRKDWEAHPNSDVPRGYLSKEPTFRLTDFIPKEEAHFYTYRGSLSWPPCFGNVIWSVYDKRLIMSKRQFDQFARIPAYGVSDSALLSDNYRALDDIFVEDEESPGLSFDDRQALINQRTVDRYVLKGKHNPDLPAFEDHEVGVVDEFGYHDTGNMGHSLTVTIPGWMIMTVVTMLLFGLA